MYTDINFKTKKALREAVAAGEQVMVYRPNSFTTAAIPDGRVFLEGPHYPQPHKWYTEVVVKDGIIVKVK